MVLLMLWAMAEWKSWVGPLMRSSSACRPSSLATMSILPLYRLSQPNAMAERTSTPRRRLQPRTKAQYQRERARQTS